MAEVKTQFSTEIAKSTLGKHCFLGAAILLFISISYYNLIASLSHLEALCLNVTSDALNNCLF